MRIALFILLFCFPEFYALAQVSKVWVADQGNNTYKNPVLYADYSDPDAIRVGDDFYMTASSFNAAPGLPILHSKDLVNWRIIGHALAKQIPAEHYSKVQHGNGVWAPAIRYHKGEFYIYYPDPDFGIYLIKSKHPAGPWSDPVLVEAGKGLIDPCPLWDEDGKTYLVHAYAGSRAGIKSIIVVKPMNTAGTKTTGTGRLVFDGHATDPTIEGPKFYKRNGYYYIFAPAGGVSTGWQLVLRSKNVYGPYERKVVMQQGASPVNGPHQGAWVTTVNQESWFLHFQDQEAYGRVVHLQPMQWVNNWPVIGMDKDGDGIGEPVLTAQKPYTRKKTIITTPADDDECNGNTLGLQWQWQANPQATWLFTDTGKGCIRLFSEKVPASYKNLWDIPNILTQKFPAEQFVLTARVKFSPNPKIDHESAGMVVLGLNYAGLWIQKNQDGLALYLMNLAEADKGTAAITTLLSKLPSDWLYLRVTVNAGAVCRFAYSTNGQDFTDAGLSFNAMPGKWVGAKLGFYCIRESQLNDSGFLEIDWVRFTRP